MIEKIINPHDAFFKQYLGHAVAAADFLRHHLPPAVVALLDLDQLHLEKDSFVDEKLRSNFSDLLYQTVTKDRCGCETRNSCPEVVGSVTERGRCPHANDG